MAETNKWISLNGWKDENDGYLYVANQEDNIKTKNITEKITFDGKLVCEMLLVVQIFYIFPECFVTITISVTENFKPSCYLENLT